MRLFSSAGVLIRNVSLPRQSTCVFDTSPSPPACTASVSLPHGPLSAA